MPVRPALAPDPRRFGRRALALTACAPHRPQASDDMRLFATAFAAGFVFVSVLIV
ncbi:MAG TPA: hypothetical protein VM265_04030 [Sphingomicrobium sp.]|nr:hypothetical protein [Sphingomicrobium sp.]